MRIWQVRHSFSLASNFAVLGLKSNAKLDEAKRKYYELAKIYHPDVNKT
jgi:DnaJ-class molecular chaperone